MLLPGTFSSHGRSCPRPSLPPLPKKLGEFCAARLSCRTADLKCRQCATDVPRLQAFRKSPALQVCMHKTGRETVAGSSRVDGLDREAGHSRPVAIPDPNRAKWAALHDNTASLRAEKRERFLDSASLAQLPCFSLIYE